jgi:hypothetical protein
MTLHFETTKSTDFVFDYLTDMNKFVSVHPIINRMDNLGNNTYLVYETLKIGFIPCSFTYPATIESNYPKKNIVIRATVMKFIRIEMVFQLRMEKNKFTKIEENIRFDTSLPVKSIMQRVFTKQHKQLFENIERLK